MTGSCADVWSVSTSGRMPRSTIFGKSSAALPRTPTDTGLPSRCARATISSASSMVAAWASR
jgi:hypothetical protein